MLVKVYVSSIDFDFSTDEEDAEEMDDEQQDNIISNHVGYYTIDVEDPDFILDELLNTVTEISGWGIDNLTYDIIKEN